MHMLSDVLMLFNMACDVDSVCRSGNICNAGHFIYLSFTIS